VYAIIEDGGKQYKVSEGDVVCVELRDLKAEQTDIEFENVLFFRDGSTTLIGQPTIPGAKVRGKLTNWVTGPKLYAMQFKRRKDSQRRVGHRQKYLAVEITGIAKP